LLLLFTRDGLDITGALALETIHPEIVPYVCPCCCDDDDNDNRVEELPPREFYAENEYLDHLCRRHFWAQLSARLPPPPPAATAAAAALVLPVCCSCPLPGCGFTTPAYAELVCHVGGLPHRKVNLLVSNSGKVKKCNHGEGENN
jgi:hypothetical protein